MSNRHYKDLMRRDADNAGMDPPGKEFPDYIPGEKMAALVRKTDEVGAEVLAELKKRREQRKAAESIKPLFDTINEVLK